MAVVVLNVLMVVLKAKNSQVVTAKYLAIRRCIVMQPNSYNSLDIDKI